MSVDLRHREELTATTRYRSGEEQFQKACIRSHKTSVAVRSRRSSFWRNFTKGVPFSYQDKEEAGRVDSVNPTPPSSRSTGTRAGGSDDVRITLTHTYARAQILSLLLFSLSCLSILGSDARNNPVCPPEAPS